MNELKWIKWMLSIIALTLVVYVLKELRAIFLPLIFAIFLSFVFAPLNSALIKRKIPKALVIVLMMVIIFVFFALIGGVIYAAINSFVVEFPKYQQRAIDAVNQYYMDFQELVLRLEVIFDRIPEWLDHASLLSPGSFSLTRVFTGTMGTFLDFMTKLFLTLIFLMFLVAGADKLKVRIEKVLTETRNKQTLNTFNNIQNQMKRYFGYKSAISLGTSLVTMLIVMIFKVDFVVLTGLLIFVLNFIPNIGSIVASFFPIIICLLEYGFGWRVIGVAFFVTTTQMVFGNIIEPNMMGERLNLSPIVVLISLIFWGWVWGIVGMMLAVPITSAINIVIKEIDEKSVISAIISGH